MFDFSFKTLVALELLGIALAVIGFLNLSEKLERMFELMRQSCSRYADWSLEKTRAVWPPHKHAKALFIDALQTLPAIVISMAVILWLTGWGDIIFDKWAGLTISWKIVTVLLLIIIIFVNELFAAFVMGRIFAFVSWIISKTFGLLARPPSGVTGSIGLIISVVCFALSHVNMGGPA